MDPVAALDPNNVKVLTDNSGARFTSPVTPSLTTVTVKAGFNTTSTWAFTLTRGRRCHCFTPYAIPLELAEKLDQLRFLQNGVRSWWPRRRMTRLRNTEADLQRVRALFAAGAVE